MCSQSHMMHMKQLACEKRWMFLDILLWCGCHTPSGQSASPETQTHEYIRYMLKEALTISMSASGEEGCSSVSFSPHESFDCGRTSLNDRLSRVSQQALHESFSLREKTMWQLCPYCLFTCLPCLVMPTSIYSRLLLDPTLMLIKIYITFNKAC